MWGMSQPDWPGHPWLQEAAHVTGKRGVRRGQWAALGRLSWTRHNFLPSHTPPSILYCIGLKAGRQTHSLVLGPKKQAGSWPPCQA